VETFVKNTLENIPEKYRDVIIEILTEHNPKLLHSLQTREKPNENNK